jgi:hypothetical protein
MEISSTSSMATKATLLPNKHSNSTRHNSSMNYPNTIAHGIPLLRASSPAWDIDSASDSTTGRCSRPLVYAIHHPFCHMSSLESVFGGVLANSRDHRRSARQRIRNLQHLSGDPFTCGLYGALPVRTRHLLRVLCLAVVTRQPELSALSNRGVFHQNAIRHHYIL